MIRWLVLLALVALILHLIGRLSREVRRWVQPDPRSAVERGGGGGTRAPEALVRCARCGTHVPRRRAIEAPGNDTRTYCSQLCLADRQAS